MTVGVTHGCQGSGLTFKHYGENTINPVAEPYTTAEDDNCVVNPIHLKDIGTPNLTVEILGVIEE